MKTRITELFGIRYPILLSGMSWISVPAMVAAVSNAGGLGILATGPLDPEQTGEAIREIRGLDPSALIILSTATPIGDARRRIGNVPGIVVLQKPFTGQEFRSALADALRTAGEMTR